MRNVYVYTREKEEKEGYIYIYIPVACTPKKEGLSKSIFFSDTSSSGLGVHSEEGERRVEVEQNNIILLTPTYNHTYLI